jgi:glycosyltransferase involved in cell wall biosynthesis
VTVGDNNEAYLRRYGVPDHKLVRGGLASDEPAFREARQHRAALRRERRAAWGLADDDFVALFVGKLIPRKRPMDLIGAVRSLHGKTRRRVVAVYAGDGELRGQLEQAARGIPEAVRILGFVNQSGLPATYAAADVLVHPAEMDPHPLTIMESNLVSLPVVVSNQVGAVGPTDTARPGENARVYPVGDVDALIRTLSAIVSAPDELTKMEAAAGRVADETGMGASVTGMLAAFSRAADAVGRP